MIVEDRHRNLDSDQVDLGDGRCESLKKGKGDVQSNISAASYGMKNIELCTVGSRSMLLAVRCALYHGFYS